MTLDAAAAGVGTTRQTWYDWESGRRIPERRYMARVFSFTRGEISPNDFYDLPSLEQLELPMTAPTPAPLLELGEADDTAAAGQPELQAAA